MPPSASRIFALLTLVLLVAGVVPAHASPDGDGPLSSLARTGLIAHDRLIIEVAPGSEEAIGARSRAAGAVRVERFDALGRAVAHVPAGAIDRIAAALEQTPGVVSVEPDAIVTAQRVPNDPLYSQQWGLARVGLPAAWKLTTGSSSTIVAVLDTGVDAGHPDLHGKLVPGRNIILGTSNTNDDHVEDGKPLGHGTQVAGVIAARTDNGAGIAGVCWQCRIMPVKVLNSTGMGTASDTARGIVWAVDNGARVLNLSLGTITDVSALRDAVGYAASRGAIVVAAAGNFSSTTRTYPAAYSEVVGVAGSRTDDTRYGWSNHGSWVDLAAPGCSTSTKRGGGYDWICGTSAAAPLVAGVAALGLAARTPQPSAEMVVSALRSSAQSSAYVSSGRLRAGPAIQWLASSGSGSPACPAGKVPAPRYTDVDPLSTHGGAIACVTWWKVASDAKTFAPKQGVSRAQMATFLAGVLTSAGVALPSASPRFSDVDPASPHARAINQLAELGVVNGYEDGRYRPGQGVSRAQMATFLVAAYELATGAGLPSGSTGFSDIGTNTHRTSIEKAFHAELARGLSSDRFAPGDRVRRDQMASFLRNVLDRFVSSGAAAPPSG